MLHLQGPKEEAIGRMQRLVVFCKGVKFDVIYRIRPTFQEFLHH